MEGLTGSYFSHVPVELIHETSPETAIVFGLVFSLASRGCKCWATIDEMAPVLHMSDEEFTEHLDILVEKEWIIPARDEDGVFLYPDVKFGRHRRDNQEE